MSVKSSEITPEKVYKRRRTLVAAGVGVLALPLLDSAYSLLTQEQESTNQMFEPLAALPDSQDLPLTPTAYDTVTGYNNYYEFGFGGLQVEETVRVTQSGAEIFSERPIDMTIL